MKTKHLLIALVLGVVSIASCSKEEVKEIVDDTVNEIAKLTADIDSVNTSFPLAAHVFYAGFPRSVTVSGTTTSGTFVSASALVDNKGQLFSKNEEVTFIYGTSLSDRHTTFDGSMTITAWDTINEKVTGTFEFTLHQGTDSAVYVTNGIFTELGK